MVWCVVVGWRWVMEVGGGVVGGGKVVVGGG